MKNRDVVRTPHLILHALREDALEKEAETCRDPVKKAYFEHTVSICRSAPQELLFHTVWSIESKKEKETIGFVRFGGEAENSRTELELVLFQPENSEKLAAEALKATVRRAFLMNRKLRFIEAWLNRSLPEVRILEKAGFERVFENDGLVRYERERKRVSFLALFLLIGTAAGIAVGSVLKNYPVCTAVGIAAGILPGALLDAAVDRAKKKKQKTERKKTD